MSGSSSTPNIDAKQILDSLDYEELFEGTALEDLEVEDGDIVEAIGRRIGEIVGRQLGEVLGGYLGALLVGNLLERSQSGEEPSEDDQEDAETDADEEGDGESGESEESDSESGGNEDASE